MNDSLQPGSLPFLVCVILRRYKRTMPVARIAALARAEQPQVSGALQRLREAGLAEKQKDGWCYRKRAR